MNKEWRCEWGGETLVYANTSNNMTTNSCEQILYAQLPGFNRAIIFNGNQWHCARSVSRVCPLLRVTLVFKAAPTGADSRRDELQCFLSSCGALERDRTKHLNRFGSKALDICFGVHMLTVYDLLKEAGHSQDLCDAGCLYLMKLTVNEY